MKTIDRCGFVVLFGFCMGFIAVLSFFTLDSYLRLSLDFNILQNLLLHSTLLVFYSRLHSPNAKANQSKFSVRVNLERNFFKYIIIAPFVTIGKVFDGNGYLKCATSCKIKKGHRKIIFSAALSIFTEGALVAKHHTCFILKSEKYNFSARNRIIQPDDCVLLFSAKKLYAIHPSFI